ncbi:hypothetical protein [Streptomyces sp. NPDC001843]|uniref:hypothetical protein n=1 Tax=Streptomyces sp. NPDC001843 TaxID=3364617 RepID=UPI0036B36360
MRVKLVKVDRTVYRTRVQWAIGKDRDGQDIVPFGGVWERDSVDDALIIAEETAASTYELAGETRRRHVWVEKVTCYRDGSEESVTLREYNRPAEPEPVVHVVSATQIVTPEGQHVLAMCGEDLGPYAEASEIHPVGNYLWSGSPQLKRVTCQPCAHRIGG